MIDLVIKILSFLYRYRLLFYFDSLSFNSDYSSEYYGLLDCYLLFFLFCMIWSSVCSLSLNVS